MPHRDTRDENFQRMNEKNKFDWFTGTNPAQKAVGAAAFAVLLSLLVVLYMWSSEPNYKVLFSGLADKDGGEVTAVLDQMNIQYKTDSSGSIMVPAGKVHDLRMKLASQGLPKGGAVGYELMDSGSKIVLSHFAEHLNYQRALEGELSRSIQSLGPVSAARVHLAIPKQTVFLRDPIKPTASVIVSLRGGRSLDKSQVAGIINLVSASVPSLSPKGVSVVDSDGNALSSNDDDGATAGGERQITHQRRIEADYSKDIESVVEKIVGSGNVKAKVRISLDFTKVEQTEEIYSPNTEPGKSTLRSSQVNEQSSGSGTPGIGGIPGASSNVPPGNASAPNTQKSLPPLPGASPAEGSSGSKSNTSNYEVDKTVRHTTKATGVIQRITVAAVVGNKSTIVAGKIAQSALTAEEVKKVSELIKQTIGFDEKRGDIVEVLNTDISKIAAIEPEAPFWKTPEFIEYGFQGGKWLVFLVAVLYAIFGVIKPTFKYAIRSAIRVTEVKAPEMAKEDQNKIMELAAPMEAPPAPDPLNSRNADFDAAVESSRKFAIEDPAAVASVIKGWIGAKDGSK